MTTVQIKLPDQLAREAEEAGLLSSERLERWLREELSVQVANRLFSAMERMSVLDGPAFMSPEEVAEEMAAMRSERRAPSFF